MHGNAWEWCADWDEWDRNRPDERAGVLRGGSWNFSPLCARSAYRLLYPPTTRFRDFGFRVALDPAEKGEPPKDDK
jgi:formylglycine-generating enzyme required for sulfatase activity